MYLSVLGALLPVYSHIETGTSRAYVRADHALARGGLYQGSACVLRHGQLSVPLSVPWLIVHLLVFPGHRIHAMSDQILT
jgi:hypothetical protein